jgi:hypothetical protein
MRSWHRKSLLSRASFSGHGVRPDPVASAAAVLAGARYQTKPIELEWVQQVHRVNDDQRAVRGDLSLVYANCCTGLIATR